MTDMIPMTQFTFKEQYSTIQQLPWLTDDITTRFLRKEHTTAFLLLCMTHGAITHIKEHIPDSYIHLLHIIHRNFKVIYQGTLSESYPIKPGVPKDLYLHQQYITYTRQKGRRCYCSHRIHIILELLKWAPQDWYHVSCTYIWGCLYFWHEGQSNENQTPAKKWQWNLFYSKVIATSVNTFIPLGDETINSSLVERDRSLMDSQPHSLLYFLSKWNKHPWMFFFMLPKKWKDLGCTEDVEVFPSQISEAYPSPDWQYGDGHYHAKGWFCLTAFQGILTLWHVPAPSVTKKRTTPLCSSLLASISNAGQTHFTLCSPPEQ